MELKFTVAGRISRPVDEVFEAVVSPDRLSKYFTTGGARGRLETGAEVTWDFHDFPGAFPVMVQEVVPNERIVLQWEADHATATWTTVTMEFSPLDDNRTLVRISEFGWPETQAGLTSSFGNCEGWTGMLCAMKAWLEHGINLRDGFYK
ncbi:SRPBCC family protein [Oceaniglobus trochenteri]|uniref:SRPBCC family protein n=1 Tax=Oceaniglobus trochenteri TaxID=2763260 RepID=UPI001CFFA5B2|nr:SRPBCC family protein [Oceaniglobus trochenteri]